MLLHCNKNYYCRKGQAGQHAGLMGPCGTNLKRNYCCSVLPQKKTQNPSTILELSNFLKSVLNYKPKMRGNSGGASGGGGGQLPPPPPMIIIIFIFACQVSGQSSMMIIPLLHYDNLKEKQN